MVTSLIHHVHQSSCMDTYVEETLCSIKSHQREMLRFLKHFKVCIVYVNIYSFTASAILAFHVLAQGYISS